MEEYGHLPYFGPPDPTRCPIHKKLFLGGLLFPPLWIVGAFLPVRDALDNCTYLSSSTRAGLLTNCRGGTFQISLSSHGHDYICHWLRITSTRNCVSGCLSINPSTIGGTTHIPNPTPCPPTTTHKLSIHPGILYRYSLADVGTCIAIFAYALVFTASFAGS